MNREPPPELKEKLEFYRNKWQAIGLSTEPTNHGLAEAATQLVYRHLKVKSPNKFQWFKSPKAMAKARMESGRFDSVWDYYNSMRLPRGWLGNFGYPSDQYKVMRHVYSMFRGKIQQTLQTKFLPLDGFSQHDAMQLAMIDFYTTERKTLKETRFLVGCMQVIMNAGWCAPGRHSCTLVERYSELHLDSDNLLHCEDGLALGYSDGWGVYAWHGLRVPEFVIMRPHLITLEKITRTNIFEFSHAMIERYGFANLIRDFNLKPSQWDEYGTLYRIPRQNSLIDIIIVHSNGRYADVDEYFIASNHNVEDPTHAILLESES